MAAMERLTKVCWVEVTVSALKIIVLSPGSPFAAVREPALAIAAARAGAIGLLDWAFSDTFAEADLAFAKLSKHAMNGGIGLRYRCGQTTDLVKELARLEEAAGENPPLFERSIIFTAGLSGFDPAKLKSEISAASSLGWKTLVECINTEEGALAQSCGASAVIAKGHEGAGRVGDITTFVLLQQFVRLLSLPVWAQGGIGLHSAAAVAACGADGIVLDSQLYLCRDSGISPQTRLRIERMDGSETTLVTGPQGQMFRIVGSGCTWNDLQKLENTAGGSTTSGGTSSAASDLLVLGQDACFARLLAQVGGTVAGAIEAIQQSVIEQLSTAAKAAALSEDSPLAVSHGTRYPIIQGAMTRVSDTSEFALKVAQGGALPFLALSLMRGADIEKLLQETQEKLGKLPWGVGLLGFVPQALRQEQMAVVNRYKPPFAMIAGGRPDQAKAMEDDGTPTYLHVPSPLLLKSFIEMGSRRFIFEGKECGGHVGPRSSFVLWQSMVEVLLESIGPRDDVSGYHIIFAGGIHDALSAAMVAALAAPLSARGIKCGFLVGTAYLFTEEAVSSGAIVDKFQKAALSCGETVLLETGPGHSIRCIDSPYKQTFKEHREKLEKEEKNPGDVREELELLNLGRLRIASKGLSKGTGPNQLVSIPVEQQWQEGMYMIGQVAALHNDVITIASLHEDLSAGGQSLLVQKEIEQSLERPAPERQAEAIAIVGMSCQFPQSNDVETFWKNILGKVDSIAEIPASHFDWKNYYDPDPQARDKIISKWGGFLSDIVFDPGIYGIPPSSLESIDPMQVLILEAARSALLDAGYGKRKFMRSKTSVILANAGHGPITALYSLRSMLGWKLEQFGENVAEQIKSEMPEWTEDSFAGYLGNVAAGRVANRLDLKGINFSIDAACASSLAALYVSISDLRSGASDVVLLGATDTHNQPGDYLSFSKTYALSPTGRCKTFDVKADGIAISEGIAMLVLKRLSDAERDGDRIYAVIRGIGGSSDGRDLSLTAPRPAGQMLALERAYADASCSPASVQIVEAHGTGTVAGDKAEVEALTRVFQAGGAAPESCAIGSVKTNIGHTKAAAGLASIVKIAKALHHKVLPPTINVSEPNPACKFGEGPFYVNSQCRPWLKSHDGGPRRGAVSAFGFGGTNFHAVLEEYVSPCAEGEPPTVEAWPAELFVWKASSNEDLLKAITQMETNCKKVRADFAIETMATSQEKRRLFDLASKHNLKSGEGRIAVGGLAIVASNFEDLERKLSEAKTIIAAGQPKSSNMLRGIHFIAPDNEAPAGKGKVAFLFPGQGSQRVDMLQELSLYFPEIRRTIEDACTVLHQNNDLPDLARYIYPAPAFSPQEADKQQVALTATNIAQPALGVCDLAMLNVLTAFGIKADMTAGHSYGEYVALHAANAFAATDLLHLSAERGRILAKCAAQQPGAMAAVSAGLDTIKQLLGGLPGVALANINSPSQCIISGDVSAIESALTALQAKGVACKRIAVSAAFHSPLMNASKEELEKALARVTINAPSIPVYSNTTTLPHEADGQVIAQRLAEHAVKPVLFAGQLEAMHDAGARIFVEVGPGNVLTGLTEATLKGRDFVAVNVERAGKNSLEHFLSLLGLLAISGVSVDLGKLYWNRLFSSRERIEQAIVSPSKKLLYKVNSIRFERLGAAAKVAPKTTAQAKPIASNGNNKAVVASSSLPQAQLPVANLKAGPLSSQPNAQSQNQQQTFAQAKPAPSRVNGNGKYPASSIASKNPNGQQSMESNNKKGNPSLPGRPDRDVDKVMLEFQQTMLEMTNRFLETQQNVMMAYLHGKQGGLTADQRLEQAQALTNLMQASQASAPMPAPAVPQSIPHNANSQPTLSTSTTADFDLNATHIVSESLEAAPLAAAAEVEGLNAESLIESLYEIVSERTGYPREMLNPELDLEADMGIDSIKRVEILNNFRKLLPESTQTKLESGIEKLAGTKTLQGIIDWIRSLEDMTDEEQAEDLNGHGGNGAGGFAGNKSIDHTLAGNGKVTGLQGSAPASAANAAVAHGNGAASARTADKVAANGRLEGNIENVARGVVVVENLPPAGITIKTLAAVTMVVADSPELSQMVCAGIESRGGKAVAFAADKLLASEESIRDTVAKIKAEYGTVGSVINLCQPSVPGQTVDGAWPRLTGTFLLARAVQADLMANAEAGFRSGFVNATYLGGDFGSNIIDGQMPLAQIAEQAGIVGLTKTIAKEMPGVYVKVVDLRASLPLQTVAMAVVSELMADDDIVEVGMIKGQRIGLGVQDMPYSKQAQLEKAALDKSSIILVTGGARGITAKIIIELARRYKPTFVIAGRLPKPKEAESASTAGLTSAKDIKAQIIEERRSKGQTVSVREVERSYQQLLREREVRSNLQELEALGATVKYYAVDVNDAAAFGQLISNIYETSTIDGIIHGAGVIEDALIKDKSVESFHRVFGTKVQSAITIADNVNFETLKFLFFFSSVVGRTGNSGQADYVSANEAVNKLALVLQQRTNARVASLMWGPWQAGMAPPELEEVFASHGWSMIQPEDGRDCFHEELSRNCSDQVEVLLVGRLMRKDAAAVTVQPETVKKNQTNGKHPAAALPVNGNGAGVGTNNGGSTTGNASINVPAHSSLNDSGNPSAVPAPSGVFLNRAVLQSHDTADMTEERSYWLPIDTKQHVYLNDHKFDGIPVMPMAVALEIMLEAARAVFPEQHLVRVSDLDIPAGIVFQSQQKDFAVDVQMDPMAEGTVAVQLTSANPKKVHFRCKVTFAKTAPAVPPTLTTALASKVSGLLDLSTLAEPSEELPLPEDVYGKWLFHGPIFQGISSILSLDTQEVLGIVAGSAPNLCVTTADASDWLVDPVLLDSAMQLAGIWARHFQDVTVLPTGFKAMHVFTAGSLGQATARVHLSESGAMNLLCDLAIYDGTGRLAILVEGLGGIASKSFNRFSSAAPVPEIAR